jgi:glycosyltransferase involved in cell wall biosynthesis
MVADETPVSHAAHASRATWSIESDLQPQSSGFADACKALQSDGVGGGDLVVVPFSTDRCVYGAAQWLRSLPPRARPAMVFNFPMPDLNWRIEDDRSRVLGEFSYFRYAARCIRALLPPSKLFLTSPVPGLCTALLEAAQHPCRVVPLGSYFPREEHFAATDADKPPRAHVSVMGEFRPEKGSEVVGDVLLEFTKLRPNKPISVHVRDDAQAIDFRSYVRKSGARSPFFLYRGTLDHDRYLRRLINSDILLLPYNWRRYAIRPSGVFAEAAAYAIVAVVPDRTWAGDKLAEGHGAGVVFRDFSVEAMIEALLTASDQYGELKAQAMAKKLAWRRSQSTLALLDNVLGQTAAN